MFHSVGEAEKSYNKPKENVNSDDSDSDDDSDSEDEAEVKVNLKKIVNLEKMKGEVKKWMDRIENKIKENGGYVPPKKREG